MAHDAVETKRRATYDDLLLVPDTMVAEIVDGDLVVTPRPATPHAFAAAEIAADLLPAFHGIEARSGPGGWWILPEPELHFGDDVLVPDLAAWRCARMPIVPDAPFIDLAPDWVCEVISPSTGALDRARKMPHYARAGVGHVWLVDPTPKTLELFRLDGEGWRLLATHEGQAVVNAAPFEALALDLTKLWAR